MCSRTASIGCQEAPGAANGEAALNCYQRRGGFFGQRSAKSVEDAEFLVETACGDQGSKVMCKRKPRGLPEPAWVIVGHFGGGVLPFKLRGGLQTGADTEVKLSAGVCDLGEMRQRAAYRRWSGVHSPVSNTFRICFADSVLKVLTFCKRIQT